MQVLVEGLQEQSRLNMMDESWRFIKVDNHEAVNIGDMEKNSVALPLPEPMLSKAYCPEAAVRAHFHRHHERGRQ